MRLLSLPKHAELWLPAYVKSRLAQAMVVKPPRRLWVMVADHFEPLGMGASRDTAFRRVNRWRDNWPRIAAEAPKDANGRCPQYTFFYPQEEYDPDIVEGIAEIVRLGIADMEVHLHHDREEPRTFITKIKEYCQRLESDHALLRRLDGRIVFGFIHGNWALDNSRPDGRFCGLRGEISLLRDLGCYADFTMPSLPSATQGRIVNQLYWCSNNRHNLPRSYDAGVAATVGGGCCGDLLMIAGPLGVRLRERLIPRLESGELAGYDLPTIARVDYWLKIAPRIGDDLFLKLYTHGAQERNFEPLLQYGLANMYSWLAERAAASNIEIHWSTAWEMYQAAMALTGAARSVPAIDVSGASQTLQTQ
jgi:hypothetical protein